MHLSDIVEVYHREGGVDAAVEMAKARRGTQFDPEIVDLFCANAAEVLAPLDAAPKQIAQELVITPKTVEHHISHIYTKIGASNRVGASLFATEHGLV